MLRITLLVALSLSTLTSAACDKKDAAPPAAPQASPPSAGKDPGPPARPAAGEVGRETLAGYEVVRKALAADDFEGAKAGATKLAALAAAAAPDAPDALRGAYQALAAAAPKVAQSPEVEAARVVFGETSKAVIGLIVASTDLADGVTAYKCPMAKEYPKWIQLDAEMANPYMGTRMLKCGGKVALEP